MTLYDKLLHDLTWSPVTIRKTADLHVGEAAVSSYISVESDCSLFNRLSFIHKSQINCMHYQFTLGQNFLVELSNIPEKTQSLHNFCLLTFVRRVEPKAPQKLFGHPSSHKQHFSHLLKKFPPLTPKYNDRVQIFPVNMSAALCKSFFCKWKNTHHLFPRWTARITWNMKSGE